MASQWQKELEQQINAETAHTFLLHGNVSDDVLHEGEFLRPYEVLPQIGLLQQAGIIAFFNLASGVRFANDEMKNLFLKLIIKPIVEEMASEARPDIKVYFESHKDEIEYALKWFGKLLLFSWEKAVGKLEGVEIPKTREAPFAVVVLEQLETQTPPESATGTSRLDRKVVATLQWWAQLPEIKKTNNIVILISDYLASVAPQLLEQSKGIIPIAVSLPDKEEQKETIEAFKSQGIFVPVKKEEGSKKELSVNELARLTSGLSRVELSQIFKQARVTEEKLTGPILFKKKSDIIAARLGNTVSLEKPPWGWEVIGGLEFQVFLAMNWVDALKRGDISQLPKGGVMLIGAPGTCKTAYAEAFACETDLPFMKIKSTYDPFVGVSERQAQMLVDTALAQEPVVLFIDEIDKWLLPHDQFYDGGGGTFTRTQAIFTEFLSDPLIHGKVIVFSATNRPHRLEAALKRAGRWGIKLPFLIPTKPERPSIFQALFRKEVIRLDLSNIKLDISEVIDDDNLIENLSAMCDFWVKDDRLVCGPPDEGEILDKERDLFPLVGAEIEDVIGLSHQPFLKMDYARLKGLSKEELLSLLHEEGKKQGRLVLTAEGLRTSLEHHLPTEEIGQYRIMNDLALASVSDLRCVPPEYRDRARKLRADAARVDSKVS